jgi:hypothetical protein
MRVRVLEDIRAYWEYAVRDFRKGEELLGDLARHIAANAPGGTVELLESDPAPAPVQVPDPDPAPSAGPGGSPADDVPPVDGTIDDLMTWVGDDKDRAARALIAEQAKDKPRSTVVKRLGGVTE